MKDDRSSEEREAQDLEKLDIREHGRAPDGGPLVSDRRLFMQLLAYGGCGDPAPLVEALKGEHIAGVLYEDVNDPTGVALLTFDEDPNFFVTALRRVLNRSPFADLTPKPEYTMLGRTYTLGHEPDLEQALLERPIGRVCNPEFPWAIWYPLRRSGTFEELSAKEQRVVLMEHVGVGRAYGKAGYGFDVRLACHGLDRNDNDFVIGLVAPELYPLSSMVQRMRKTRQTSLH